MDDELNKAYESINHEKYWHLGALSAIASKLLREGKTKDAKLIKDAIDFFNKYN